MSPKTRCDSCTKLQKQCDRQRPTCGNCVSRKKECTWVTVDSQNNSLVSETPVPVAAPTIPAARSAPLASEAQLAPVATPFAFTPLALQAPLAPPAPTRTSGRSGRRRRLTPVVPSVVSTPMLNRMGRIATAVAGVGPDATPVYDRALVYPSGGRYGRADEICVPAGIIINLFHNTFVQ